MLSAMAVSASALIPALGRTGFTVLPGQSKVISCPNLWEPLSSNELQSGILIQAYDFLADNVVNRYEARSDRHVGRHDFRTDFPCWWPGDGNAIDVYGGNNGILQNGTTFAPGKVGQAFNFDGNGYVSAPTTNLPTGNEDRTLLMWVNINSYIPGDNFFAGYGAFGIEQASYHLGISADLLWFSQWGLVLFGPHLNTGTWYHVAVTNVGNDVILYLDGVAVSSGTLAINTPLETQFYMGRIPGKLGDARKLNGLIDEVQLYNRALSAAEIQTIANA